MGQQGQLRTCLAVTVAGGAVVQVNSQMKALTATLENETKLMADKNEQRAAMEARLVAQRQRKERLVVKETSQEDTTVKEKLQTIQVRGACVFGSGVQPRGWCAGALWLHFGVQCGSGSGEAGGEKGADERV